MENGRALSGLDFPQHVMQNHKVFVLQCQRVVMELILQGPEVDIIVLGFGDVSLQKRNKKEGVIIAGPLPFMKGQGYGIEHPHQGGTACFSRQEGVTAENKDMLVFARTLVQDDPNPLCGGITVQGQREFGLVHSTGAETRASFRACQAC